MVSRIRLRKALAFALGLAWTLPLGAATFGLPTAIGTDGRVCTGVNAPAGIGCTAAALDPPGYLILHGANDVDAAGDTTHQMRLFIEVTGTTLDIRVFDAGRDGLRDDPQNNNTTFTYTLFNAAGTQLKQIAIGADAAATTENRVARMSSAAADTAFVALNAGTAFTVTPGLHELRITGSGAGGGTSNARNGFGVDIRAATGAAAAHYNVYTYGLDDDLTVNNVPAAADTSLIIGALSTGTNGATITQGMVTYPYVTRGCALQTSNYDMDSSAGASTSITDVLGTATALTVSGATVHAENSATIHATTGTQTDVNNYGLYSLQNNTGAQFNVIDWRIADFQGWADNPAAIPRDTVDAFRTYLPNGYTGGVPPLTNATAPQEPVLVATVAYVSGANPPAVGVATRFQVVVLLYNPGPAAIRLNAANDQIRVGLPTGATAVGNQRCFVNDLFTSAGTPSITGTFVRCNFSGAGVTLNPGDTAGLRYRFNITPGAAGSFAVTNPPAAPSSGTYNAGGIAPDSTLWAQYSRFTGTGATIKPETLGPLCDLRATTGVSLTRATLAGLRVEPGTGDVTFAIRAQRRGARFDVWGSDLPAGRGARTRLNAAPIVAQPDAAGTAIYQVPGHGRRFASILVEEIDELGRRHLMGPFTGHDTRLEQALAAAREQADAAHQARRLPRPVAERVATVVTPATFEPLGVAVETRGPGRVRVAWDDLRAAGLPEVKPARVRVSSLGSLVPFDFERDADGQPVALRFDDPGAWSAQAGTNVLVVTWDGQPARAPSVSPTYDEPAPVSGSVRIAPERLYAPSAARGSERWIWDYVVAGEPWPRADDPDAGQFDLPRLDRRVRGLARVRLLLAGASPGVHRVSARINDVPIGALTLAGRSAGTLEGSLPLGALQSAGNRLALAVVSEPEASALVYLGALDVSAPWVGSPDELAPVRVRPYAPRALEGNTSEVLVIAPEGLLPAAEDFASLLRARGRTAEVLDAQALYDRHTGGLVDAAALHAALREAFAAGSLREVVLLGDDSHDPRGLSAPAPRDFLPSLQAWDAEFGRLVSENLSADLDGDGAPDIVISRLPVGDLDEARALVAKLARGAGQVRAGRGPGTQVLAVDNSLGDDPAFEKIAALAASLLPAGDTQAWARVAEGVAPARQALMSSLDGGAAAVHYFGHGAFDRWADEHLLGLADVAQLGHVPETVAFTWACEAQWYDSPFGPALGEALVRMPSGGALASFGPAGITSPDGQVALMQALYARLYAQGLPLGEAVRQAKVELMQRDPERYRAVVEGWNLLGDPEVRLR